ncbi:MAG TPA: hypothetical protein VMW01_04755 [Williamwhitmania sp.]|nr:hypothetical protein [Williamwhitmania sp.]
MGIISNKEIKDRLNKALDKLYVRDWYLLKNGVHERSITHKLAEYIQELFPDYDVDCEYDRDNENEDGNFKKQIHELVTEELRYRKKSITKIPNDGWMEDKDLNMYISIFHRNFFPDIIVHKRGTNSHNLLIIEAKKALINTEFDKKKLAAYTNTNNSFGNNLKYRLGVLLVLSIDENFSRKDVKPIYFP